MGSSAPRTVSVIDQFLCSKYGSGDGGDDRIVVGDRFAAVIDGSTAKTAHTYRLNRTVVRSGTFAAGVLAAAVADQFATTAPNTPVELFTVLSQDLDRAVTQQHPDLPLRDRPSASIVVYSADHHEVWWLGDCAFRFNGDTYAPSNRIDEVAADFRAAVRAAILAGGHDPNETGDAGRDAIMPLLRHQGSLANTRGEFGYPVLNGDPAAATHAACMGLPEDLDELILASDGYTELDDDLDTTEMLHRRSLVADPHRDRLHRSTKGLEPGAESFDDRAYLRISLTV